MTTLSTAIEATGGLIQTDTALSLGAVPAPITIDSEAMLVTGDEAGTVYSVSRGENGTARATHARGATVTLGWASGDAPAAPAASAVTYDPAVLGETDGQAVAEALAAAISVPTLTEVLAEGNAVPGDGTITGPEIEGIPAVIQFGADGGILASSDTGAIIRVSHDGGVELGGAMGGTLQLGAGGSSALDLNSVIIRMPNLPTADPLQAGELWNNNGVLTISNG